MTVYLLLILIVAIITLSYQRFMKLASVSTKTVKLRLKRTAKVLSWASLIAVLIVEMSLLATPKSKYGFGNLPILIGFLPLILFSIISVILSCKNYVSVWTKIGLSSVVFLTLIIVQIRTVHNENQRKRYERINETQQYIPEEKEVSDEIAMQLGKIDKMSRSQLLQFSIDNDIQFCEDAHTATNGDSDAAKCEIFVHLHDSYSLQRCRANVGTAYMWTK